MDRTFYKEKTYVCIAFVYLNIHYMSNYDKYKKIFNIVHFIWNIAIILKDQRSILIVLLCFYVIKNELLFNNIKRIGEIQNSLLVATHAHKLISI